MDKKIEKIVNDLYMIDGSLKKHEKEVVHIVEELLRSKPDIEVNKEFIEKLHITLVDRMEYLKRNQGSGIAPFMDFGFGKKFAYSFSAAVLIFSMIAAASYYIYQKKNSPDIVAIAPGKEISKTKDGAFGSLLSQAPAGLGGEAGAPSGIGGGAVSVQGSTARDKSIGVPYGLVKYRYIYKGGDIEVPNEKVSVYKRVKELPLQDNIASLLGNANFGLINLAKFSDKRVNNIIISEDREFGYDVNLDFREGAININSNWLKWPNPNAGCRDEACYESNLLKESDIPSKENLIALADKFLNDYQIDKKLYGNPTVLDNYGWAFRGVEKSSFQIPETISVSYPLIINGMASYNQSGDPEGLLVDINIRYKKVFGARNIFLQKFESSDYEAVTDKSKIISYAEKGGLYGNYGFSDAEKTIDVELGTPQVGLVLVWGYEQEKGTGNNLYVPAYMFPVAKASEEGYVYQKNIIVPMAKEMFDGNNGGFGTMESGIRIRQ